ncbi:PilZ domain-containing protein [Sphingobium sp. WCS2017Hpa-17]|uniref:PilZ domain-containing protein n=1 Tax=Sphingobium sp. WCS2017Hpa-17 TaxID=3073638 RepID=UPI00288B100F|nr:PilZ domain-containing protein [Sphingobium sp. WCS2017Hpa-17]
MPHGLEQASPTPILTILPDLTDDLPFNPMERRQDWRAATVFTIGKISFAGRSLPCMVRDLSDGGMRIQMPFPPAPGTRILIEMRGLEPRLARICWTSGHEAGLMFDLRCSPADIFAARSNKAGRIARQPRFAFRRDASLIVDDIPVPARIENISVGGVRLAVPTLLERGKPGVLDLMLGDRQGMAGEICWVQEDSCGFRFIQPVSSVALANMLDTPDLI